MLCPFCGVDSDTCTNPKCMEASQRLPLVKTDTRGIPRKRNAPQPEAERVRKQVCTRILPDLARRIRAEAARQGLSLAEYWERHALTLPPA